MSFYKIRSRIVTIWIVYSNFKKIAQSGSYRLYTNKRFCSLFHIKFSPLRTGYQHFIDFHSVRDLFSTIHLYICFKKSKRKRGVECYAVKRKSTIFRYPILPHFRERSAQKTSLLSFSCKQIENMQL